MTDLIAQTKTMSSREIAVLTEKEHKNVKADINKMLADLGEDALTFQRIYLDSMNREQIEYLLDRELTDTLLTGYSAVLRRRVIARWRELEQEALKPALPNFMDPAAAARAWADAKEAEQRVSAKVDQLEHEVAELAPAAAGLDRIANVGDAMCVTDAAKTLQVAPGKLRDLLLEKKWMYPRQGKSGHIAYQDKIHAGYLKHKYFSYQDPESGEQKAKAQVLVTSKGIAKLAKLLSAPTVQLLGAA